MTAHDLVEELSVQGVKLWADGDKLRCRGPRRVMTPAAVARLEEHKAAILEALEGRHSNPATVAGLEKTTADIAKEAGMSERSWRNRTKIGRGLGTTRLA